ncbi:crotonase/enoyl-CoA hydratase family protein [Halosolutus amylolyticus]|uniref:Crotonase/enoyl-CoA hydratase family protein n=1 Tax=Halosolutus amylolyticus TaxID=2932267 RepID=A0ABD5PSB9_9EURY|nr:crotonase/enoyl-CoA hydratase family protein [Halosolutus amylolyticus]
MVTYDRTGPVAVIGIDRPGAKHAIDRETAIELGDAWRRFDDDEDALVGVLTGDEETFSAGADLKEMDLEDGDDGWLGFTRMQVAKPTIAAVEGHCVAGGLEMALWCDLRVAGEGATFGCFERRFGVPLVDGGTQRLPRIVGRGRALEMILTGRPVDAAEAREWGLVNRVVDDGAALETAIELGERIAAFPQTTVRTDRAALYEGLGEPIEKGLQIEAWHGRRALETAVEGADRFAAGEGRHGDGIDDPVERHHERGRDADDRQDEKSG